MNGGLELDEDLIQPGVGTDLSWPYISQIFVRIETSRVYVRYTPE